MIDDHNLIDEQLVEAEIDRLNKKYDAQENSDQKEDQDDDN